MRRIAITLSVCGALLAWPMATSAHAQTDDSTATEDEGRSARESPTPEDEATSFFSPAVSLLGEEGPLGMPVWLWVLLGVSAAAALAFWLRGRRTTSARGWVHPPPQRHSRPRTAISSQAATTQGRKHGQALPPQIATDVQDLLNKVSTLSGKVGTLEIQVAELQRLVASQPSGQPLGSPSTETRHPALETRSVPDEVPVQARLPSVEEVFAEWCQTKGALVHQRELFEAHLGEVLAPTKVEAVYRDLDSASRPISFDDKGGASPAEHWLLHSDGGPFLFPKPQGPSQFRDLSPVFDGMVTPATVREVVPARVRRDGARYVLTQPGRVS